MITLAAVATFLVAVVILRGTAGLSAPYQAIAQLALIAVPVIVAGKTRRDRRALGLARPTARQILGACMVGSCAWYVNLLLLALLPTDAEVPQGIQQAVQQPPFLLVLLTVAIVPAIAEEVLFRGVLVRGLGTRLKPWVAIVAGALAFSLYHLNPIQALPTFTLGLAFGVIAMRAHSAIPTMFAHALNNGIAIAVSREVVPGLANTTGTGFLDRHPVVMGGAALAIVAGGLALVVTEHRQVARGMG